MNDNEMIEGTENLLEVEPKVTAENMYELKKDWSQRLTVHAALSIARRKKICECINEYGKLLDLKELMKYFQNLQPVTLEFDLRVLEHAGLVSAYEKYCGYKISELGEEVLELKDYRSLMDPDL